MNSAGKNDLLNYMHKKLKKPLYMSPIDFFVCFEIAVEPVMFIDFIWECPFTETENKVLFSMSFIMCTFLSILVTPIRILLKVLCHPSWLFHGHFDHKTNYFLAEQSGNNSNVILIVKKTAVVSTVLQIQITFISVLMLLIPNKNFKSFGWQQKPKRCWAHLFIKTSYHMTAKPIPQRLFIYKWY